MAISHEAFLHAICEAPEDDTPRLVYADWLDDQGEGGRAEFIRTQIELTRPELAMERVPVLLQREKELLATHETTWRRPFREDHGPRFARGFVHSIKTGAHELLDNGAEYFQAAPLESVKFTTLGDDSEGGIEALAGCSFLSRLRMLDFYDCMVGESAGKFFASPHLTSLRTLWLGEGDATPEMVRILGGASLPALRELYLWDFHSGDLGNAGLALLANTPAFANLTTLDLLHTGARMEGARALAESPYLHRLEHLSLGRQECGYTPNRIGPEGAQALAGAQHLGGLRTLGLALNHIGDVGLAALAASPHLRRLESLWLGINQIGHEGLTALAGSPVLANLRQLDLSHNQVGDAGVIALAGSPFASRLESLWLWGNGVGEAGVEALMASPHLVKLRSLGLPQNPLGPGVVDVLLHSPLSEQLELLNLVHSPLPDAEKERLKRHFGDRVKV